LGVSSFDPPLAEGPPWGIVQIVRGGGGSLDSRGLGPSGPFCLFLAGFRLKSALQRRIGGLGEDSVLVQRKDWFGCLGDSLYTEIIHILPN